MTIRRSATAHVVLLAWPFLSWTQSAVAADYSVESERSQLGFVARQSDANFEGRFKTFTAKIRFDEKHLASSRFDVKIDLRSVTTQEAQRDDMLKGADFFAISRFAEASFVASSFTRTPNGSYLALGKLQLRGISRDVPIAFTWHDAGGGIAVLEGRAALKRLDFGVGQGDWEDTHWVGNDVQVKFKLQLRPATGSAPKR